MNEPQPIVPGKAARGALWLVSGLLAFPVWPFGALAWIMGNRDLKAMTAGKLDPSGEGLTKAGKILGIIGLVVNLLWIGKRIVIDGIGNMGTLPPR